MRLSPKSASEDGRDLQSGGAGLPQQGERQPPLLLKPHRRGDFRALPRVGRQPVVGQIQRRAQHPRANTGPQRRRHRDLTIRDFAQRAAVLARDADRLRALFGKARRVENQHAFAVRDHRSQLPPDAGDIPRRVADEMLNGLIGTRVVDTLEHRAHRLPATVAEQTEQVASKGATLRQVTEARFERLEPRTQAIEPHRRIAWQQHRASAYRNCSNRTMSPNQITRRILREISDLTK